MGVTYDREERSEFGRVYPDDRVIAERPARRTHDDYNREMARTYARPVVEFGGLVVNHTVTDIERYARVMGWDTE